MRYAALSETGRGREQNEDSYRADGRIFIVADGMGGHRAGEVASSGAIEEFMRFERENHAMGPLDRIIGAMLSANERLYNMALTDPGLAGMGTTFTVTIYEQELYLGHVGDSRAYLFRDGGLAMLTRDHSLVEQMVREGYISRREARTHPQRNVILRALGVSDDLEMDLDSMTVLAGDWLLLCSDGLSGVLEDEEIVAFLSDLDEPERGCRELMNAAKDRGGTDDITAVLINFDENLSPSPASLAMDQGKVKKAWWKSFLPERLR